MGDLSKNFSAWEFKCGHCGRLVGPSVLLLQALQRLRDDVGRPLAIVSGYRCAEGNRSVGGTRDSQHLCGNAVDVPAGYTSAARAHRAGFVGVGIRAGRVVHLDMTPGRQPFTFKD